MPFSTPSRAARSAISCLVRARNFGAIATALLLGAGALVSPPSIAADVAGSASSASSTRSADPDASAIGPLRLGSVKNLKDEAEAIEADSVEADSVEADSVEADTSDAEATPDALPLDPDLTLPDRPVPAPIDTTPVSPEAPEVPETPASRPLQRKAQTRIQLDLSDRQLSVYADDELVATYTVAVGKDGWETPVGDFSVTHMAIDPIWENPWTGELIYPGPNNPMGRAVIVFHTVGDDMIAFHGTPNEGLLGQAVSHGCVRMRNADILEMYEIVRYGTAVSVVP